MRAGELAQRRAEEGVGTSGVSYPQDELLLQLVEARCQDMK